ncbi:hypothetical protein Poli38472_005776 [Pythium oligandrum]|uniref:pantothenate kinase n=1 Tax=Pythium oligandrum TaxID=41045 RepID=A0A8K1FS83_PYTOL|nr:hypothetical protein Poli38472_005776 [Pythium oligandrum]|eukprot:TMW68308.1 hypothetical protein Poli38472_005776 [Pythium oligandrum]
MPLDALALERVLLTSSFLVFSSSVALLCCRRKKARHRLWRQRVTFKKISKHSDLGQCFGLDIGGTLGKIVFFEHRESSSTATNPNASSPPTTTSTTGAHGEHRRRRRAPSLDQAAGEMTKFLHENENIGATGVQDVRLRVYSKALQGVFHFIRFETRYTQEAVELIAAHGLNQSLRSIPCTGGGAHKYAPYFSEMAGIELEKYDEIECTILGLNFLLTTLSDEVYTFEDVDAKAMAASRMKVIQYDMDEGVYPYLLVSIGSGVSVLHVKGPNDFERVSGSSIGGGTYWGLCRLLTKCRSYDEALDIAVNGSNYNVDMSVGDIYGGSYDKFNLPATTVASSFGRMMTTPRENVTDADIARSLLVMVTQNIGQIAFLNSCLYKTKRIFFVGNFLRHNKISARTLSYAINFWSKGDMQARFCKHEGYLGALGAFMRNAELTNMHGEAFATMMRGEFQRF